MQNDDYKIIILTVNALKRNARQLHVAEKLLTEYKQEKGSNFPFLYLDDREFYKTVEHILEENDVNELFFIDSQIKSIIEQKNFYGKAKKK